MASGSVEVLADLQHQVVHALLNTAVIARNAHLLHHAPNSPRPLHTHLLRLVVPDELRDVGAGAAAVEAPASQWERGREGGVTA